ncbi:MAG TPA: DUF1905 domain-containing protein [Candidatus Saccharimonadales bacterium]|nr:DUF1905 domain-containing protein [Candidatus Saccharimonadales bacterium]
MLDKTFTGVIEVGPNRGSWPTVIWPEAASFFKTKGLVRVRGTIDGYPFEASFMATGGGVHMLPIRAEIRKAINKQVGDSVTIHLQQRLK